MQCSQLLNNQPHNPMTRKQIEAMLQVISEDFEYYNKQFFKNPTHVPIVTVLLYLQVRKRELEAALSVTEPQSPLPVSLEAESQSSQQD
jgi:hypothetical protein